MGGGGEIFNRYAFGVGLRYANLSNIMLGISNSLFENTNSSFQNTNTSFQNTNTSFQNTNSSFQNTNSSFQNTNTSFQNTNTSFQNTNSSFQNTNSSFQIKDGPKLTLTWTASRVRLWFRVRVRSGSNSASHRTLILAFMIPNLAVCFWRGFHNFTVCASNKLLSFSISLCWTMISVRKKRRLSKRMP